MDRIEEMCGVVLVGVWIIAALLTALHYARERQKKPPEE